MIRTMLVDSNKHYSFGGEEQLGRWRNEESGFIWLDISAEPTETLREMLLSLGCNSLAINDSFRLRHPPKVEAFDNDTFVLFRGISTIDTNLEVSHQQLGLWVGERILITYHRENSMSVSFLWDQEQNNKTHQSPGVLALKLLHYACGLYLDTLLEFEDRLVEIGWPLQLLDRGSVDGRHSASPGFARLSGQALHRHDFRFAGRRS